MTRQWASDYAPFKSNTDDPNGTDNGEGGSKINNNTKQDSMQTPQKLLEAMGIFGESVDHDGEDSINKRDGVSIQKKGKNYKRNNDIDDLKGMIQKVIFNKFDEVQSSLSKPSPSVKRVKPIVSTIPPTRQRTWKTSIYFQNLSPLPIMYPYS